MIAWRVWDVMRTLDYIATRSELDSSRVGCMGISGGGTVTSFSTALEPRIRVAMVSGYVNTFRDSVGSLAHCIDNYVPGILNWAEMYDIAGLIAPRPLFVESGEKDNIFPIAASVESFNRVREIYSVFGAADRVEQEVFPGEHSFWGKRGVPFLARHLAARARPHLHASRNACSATRGAIAASTGSVRRIGPWLTIRYSSSERCFCCHAAMHALMQRRKLARGNTAASSSSRSGCSA